MSRFEGPQGIVTNGLVLNLDAGDPDSYTRSQPPYVEVLVVAGGGGGSGNFYDDGAGGGGGGLIYNSAFQLTNAAAITVTVGAGGTASTGGGGGLGGNSVFDSLTAIGGGGGAPHRSTGLPGGSGGGGGGSIAGDNRNVSGGAGTPGQGNNGGSDPINGGNYPGSGGGGGAGSVGGTPTGGGTNQGGNGGVGLQLSISGTPTYYAGGGGGVRNGIGGLGGGGTASYGRGGSPAENGTPNTGGGGGGGRASAGETGVPGAGGSGIVIVRYPGLPAATGGTITYLNGYTIHTFTSSGTFTPYLWNELTGTGYNTTLSNNVFDPPVGTMLFTNGIAKYLPGGVLTDFPNTPSANATIVILSTIKIPNGNWKTLVRGAGADHQVIINFGDGVTLGMYDNNGVGFISSGFDFSTIADRSTAYHVYFWKLSTSSPYYQFYYDTNTSSPSGTITDANATFNNGFAGVGAYHDGSSNPNNFSQEWGNIKVFLYYNRHLSQAEMDQIYNTLKLRR